MEQIKTPEENPILRLKSSFDSAIAEINPAIVLVLIEYDGFMYYLIFKHKAYPRIRYSYSISIDDMLAHENPIDAITDICTVAIDDLEWYARRKEGEIK